MFGEGGETINGLIRSISTVPCLCRPCLVWSLPRTYPFHAVIEAALSQGKGLADVVFSSAQLNLDKE